MRSSIVAIVVFVLGLSATISSAQTCTTKCDVVKNGTVEWENGVQITIEGSITLTVSKAESVIVFYNLQTGIVIVFDMKANLQLIFQKDQTFGLVIDMKTGGCVKVTLNIQLVIDGDFTELRKVLDQAKIDISGQGAAVIIINLNFVKKISFSIGDIFVSGSATIIAEIKLSYSFIFEAAFNAVVVIGKDVNLAGALVVVIFGRATQIAVGVAKSFALVIRGGVMFTVKFGVFIAQSIQTTSVDIYLKFTAAFESFKGDLDKCIDEAKKGVTIDKSITVLSFTFRFLIVLVNDFLQFALTLGKINIDIGYSGKALAVFNAKANIVFVIAGSYSFAYSYDLQAGFLFKGDKCVYVTLDTITAKLGQNVDISTGRIAAFINVNADAVFSSSKQIAIKDLKAALESEAKFVAFCDANGIANGALAYKVFAKYANAIGGFLGYSFDVAVSLRVSFSLSASYELDSSVYSNLLVTAFASALSVVTKFTSSVTLFAALKITLA